MLSHRIFLWFILTVAFVIVATKFYFRYALHRLSSNGKNGNKLGKAMVNMERACVFGDCVNFYEFTKYAIREAMKLPQGKEGLLLSVETIISKLNGRDVPVEIKATVTEVYEIGAQIENDGSEEPDVDLSEKLSKYYEAIRKLNVLFD